MKPRSIKDIKNLRGKRVLVRVDFDVPVSDSEVVDDFRIRKALPTIEFLKREGAKVILIGHIGREGESLEPVARYLDKFIKNTFVPKGEEKEKTDQMKEGDVLVLENLRKHSGEVKNDETFARWLAYLADLYVNEAFAASHRKHSSIVGVPKYLPSYSGLQLEQEIKHLGGVLEKPKRPFLFILGGAKFETKLPLIQKFLKHADSVFVGGALANDFFYEKGYEIGKSVVGEGKFDLEELLENERLSLPIDVVVKKGDKVAIKKPQEVSKDEIIVDVGPESLEKLRKLVQESKFVVWNGPLGWYEKDFEEATTKLLDILAESKAKIIIGGGDTVSLIAKSKLGNRAYSLEPNIFVSTGGGAMLEFLEKGTLLGIKALENEQKT